MSRWLNAILLASMLFILGFACSQAEDLVGSVLSVEQERVQGDAQGGEATRTALAMATPSAQPEAYVNFVINVHDWLHLGDSGDTILRLVDIFERYGVRGEFYVTAPMIRAYQEQRPDVIERLRGSDMTISYHFRAPHPGTPMFGGVFEGKSGEELAQLIRDYETYRLDMATGKLNYDEWGGYSYVKQVLGRPPVVASLPNKQHRAVGLPIFAELGAGATVVYHEAGTDPDKPFEYTNGLLNRPSDLSITRWALEPGARENFWWNYLDHPRGAGQTPLLALKTQLAAWRGDRAPFVTSLIHENNFYRKGATPFALVYYTDQNKKQAKAPPYDLKAEDPSRARTEQNQEQIWQAYEELVAYAAGNLRVVTSADIVQMAMSDPTPAPGQRAPSHSQSASAPASAAPLALGIMVHLEGWRARDQAGFDRYAALIRATAESFERHGAKLTLEAKEPIETIPRYGDNFLAELEQRGHGIGVHADKGWDRGEVPSLAAFTGDLKSMRTGLEALGVEVRHVSGICSPEDWVSAAIDAGYGFHTGDVGFCYRSMPSSQRPSQFVDCRAPGACHDPAITDLSRRIHPWRAKDGASWDRHDPKGELVILPSSHTLDCYHEAMTTAGNHLKCALDDQDISAFLQELDQAIAIADPDQVNMLYVSWSLGRPMDQALLERWLSAIDPYVADGRVVWKTLPEIYDMYLGSEG
jgi:hypothetical protein